MQLVLPTNPILHAIAAEVEDPKSAKHLIGYMFMMMEMNNGIGLAAPQIGESVRVIVMNVNGLKLGIVNPVLTKRYGGLKTSKEGCLSFPLKRVAKVRHNQVVIEGFNADGVAIKHKLKGLAAFCAQHEVDHLNGVTI